MNLTYFADSYTLEDRLAEMGQWDPSGALFSSLMVMAIIAILAIIIGIVVRKSDPYKTPGKFMTLVEAFYNMCHNLVLDNMGEGWDSFTGYFMCLFSYLFLAFIWPLTGLPGIIENTFAPLALATVMLFLIHKTAIKYQKWHYFHRYVDPVFVFLPINILTTFTPALSTTLRMFGNALSGTIIITLISWALGQVSSSLFSFMGAGLSSIWLAPIPIGVLNLYFGLFSGYIQTLVFCSLNACWIAAEKPEQVMGDEAQTLRGPEVKE